jgi:DNA-binding response OmpR family regulator
VRVLLVDDDEEMVDAITRGFRLEWPSCAIGTAFDGEAGLRAFAAQNPDMVVLDLNMPNLNGFELVAEIRRLSDVPIIMLSSRPTEDNHIRGLDLGADDYILKPFSIPTLLARVRALLRRAAPHLIASSGDRLVFQDLIIDANTQQVTVCGEQVQLTPAEFRLLYELARTPNRVISNRELRERVWGATWHATANDLKALVHRMRVKLRESSRQSRFIANHRRLGYRFTAEPLGPGPPFGITDED